MTTDNLVRGQTNSPDQLTAAGTNHAGEPTADELDRAWGGTPPKTKTQTEMIRLQKAIKVNQAQQARLMLQAYRLAVRLFRLREKQAAIVATNKTAFVSRGRFAAKSPGGGLRFTSHRNCSM
jgi:hypothetical protein